jgi:hypothetical protein
MSRVASGRYSPSKMCVCAPTRCRDTHDLGFELAPHRPFGAGAPVLRIVAVVPPWAKNAETEARYWAGRQRVSVGCALCRKQLAEGVSLASAREILDRHLAHAHPKFTPRRGKQLRSKQA